MNIDGFWTLVGRVHAAAPSDMDKKCRLLEAELHQLSCEEILSFDGHFTNLFYQAYNWDLWAAAYIIDKVCSNDSLMDFRSTLISLGREAYEAGLRDADSLVGFDIEPAWATYEGYQYVAPEVWQAKCRTRATDPYEELKGSKPHPKEPTGRDWQEWDLHELYPRLAAKYGWRERDWSADKKRYEKLAQDEDTGRQVAELLLDAGIIPSCGLIPPPRIALEVIRSGQSPAPSAQTTTWQPLDLDEGHYWIAVRHLHQRAAAALLRRPDLAGVSIAVDTQAGTATTYSDWVDSLRTRALAWP